MLEEFHQELERLRKAYHLGKILVWWILLPAALLFASFRIWQAFH
jgi:dolichyl-phosphate-mannose--protein O-mannosyl transferase